MIPRMSRKQLTRESMSAHICIIPAILNDHVYCMHKINSAEGIYNRLNNLDLKKFRSQLRAERRFLFLLQLEWKSKHTNL